MRIFVKDATSLAVPMSPNKGETAVRMREVLARPGLRAFACAIGLRTNVLSQVNIIYDISKQTEQRARMGKIFARWHLAIAIMHLSM